MTSGHSALIEEAEKGEIKLVDHNYFPGLYCPK